MKALMVAVTISVLGLSGYAHSEETIGEKAEATANDAARGAKKGMHRVQEAACAESDTQCLAEKAKHRAEEGKDYSRDKLKELKNDVDSKKD